MTDARKPPLRSLVLETNLGGVGVSICACGAMLLHDVMSWQHIDNCPTWLLAAGEADDA